VTIVPNGRPSIRLTLPTLGAVSSIVGLVIFIVGWGFGYLTFKADMTAIAQHVAELRSDNTVLQERVGRLSDVINTDSSRLATLEADIRYISQGVAELKLAVVPKR
jgi:hypothetical protein